MSLIRASQSTTRYLLVDDTSTPDAGPTAQIVDTRVKVVYPPKSLDSHLARGYWEPVDLTQAESDAIVAQCEAFSPPTPR